MPTLGDPENPNHGIQSIQSTRASAAATLSRCPGDEATTEPKSTPVPEKQPSLTPPESQPEEKLPEVPHESQPEVPVEVDPPSKGVTDQVNP